MYAFPMTRGRDLRSVVAGCVPPRLRSALYRLRVQGASNYSRNKWRRATRRAAEPQAGRPFEIGAPVPIVLHESTVPAVRSHWVDAGGMKELDAFRRLAQGRTAFLDIGAAQGIFAAAFCALTGGNALALEPSPEMFEGLVAMITLNPDFTITPFKLALGAVAGLQPVEAHGAQLRGVASSDSGAETMVVETLDSFVGRNELAPEFVKIDVEGMELDVLRGGAATFSGPVAAIMLEIHPKILQGRGEAISDVQALLEGFGFGLFTLDLVPIADLDTHVAGKRGAPARAINIVCQKGEALRQGAPIEQVDTRGLAPANPTEFPANQG